MVECLCQESSNPVQILFKGNKTVLILVNFRKYFIEDACFELFHICKYKSIDEQQNEFVLVQRLLSRVFCDVDT